MLNPTTPLTANPWEYQEPFKTIMGLVVSILIGGAALLFLYFTCTPIPLLTFDSQVISYQLLPLKRGSIRWEDVETIWAERTRPNQVGAGWLFRVHIKPTVGKTAERDNPMRE